MLYYLLVVDDALDCEASEYIGTAEVCNVKVTAVILMLGVTITGV